MSSVMVEVRWFALLVLLVFVATSATRTVHSPVAHAAEEEIEAGRDGEARQQFELGREAYDHGLFSQARGHFEKAFELSRRRELLFNIGRAADAEGNATRAISAYTAYLEVFPEAHNRDFVRARLERMRAEEAEQASTTARSDVRPSVPAPAEVAHAMIDPGIPAATSPPPDNGQPPRALWRRGWFWGVVGAVVAGGVTAGVLLAGKREPQHAAADAQVPTR